MSSPEPYVCTLDADTQKKALTELNEDPKNRQGAIDTFRAWILEQKHIKCPTDNVFLLAFLRARKFSQLEARKQLENYLRRRDKLSSWFKDMDPGDALTQTVVGDGLFLLLPGRDKDGRRVFMLRLGKVDLSDKRYKKRDMFRAFATMLDYNYLCDEMTQVHGSVAIVDFSHMTIAHQTKISMEERKNFISTWQKNYPARIKAVHLYNMGNFIEFILMVIKVAMSEKVQKRLVLHSHGLESLYKQVPRSILPEEYLEDDYTGPSGGSEQQIIDKQKEIWCSPEIRDRIKHLSSQEFHIDMSQKDTDVPQASFRKLNID